VIDVLIGRQVGSHKEVFSVGKTADWKDRVVRCRTVKGMNLDDRNTSFLISRDAIVVAIWCHCHQLTW